MQSTEIKKNGKDFMISKHKIGKLFKQVGIIHQLIVYKGIKIENSQKKKLAPLTQHPICASPPTKVVSGGRGMST